MNLEFSYEEKQTYEDETSYEEKLTPTVGVSVHRMAKNCRLYQCKGRGSVLVCG